MSWARKVTERIYLGARLQLKISKTKFLYFDLDKVTSRTLGVKVLKNIKYLVYCNAILVYSFTTVLGHRGHCAR